MSEPKFVESDGAWPVAPSVDVYAKLAQVWVVFEPEPFVSFHVWVIEVGRPSLL